MAKAAKGSNQKIVKKILKELHGFGLEIEIDYKTYEVMGIKIEAPIAKCSRTPI